MGYATQPPESDKMNAEQRVGLIVKNAIVEVEGERGGEARFVGEVESSKARQVASLIAPRAAAFPRRGEL
jgi:hypothetical protein